MRFRCLCRWRGRFALTDTHPKSFCTGCTLLTWSATCPDYGFDPVNTRLGRHLAVDLFLRSHVMRPPYPPRMVAAAIWNSESALCDRTLALDARARRYVGEHSDADLTYRGLPVEQHAEINAWIAPSVRR